MPRRNPPTKPPRLLRSALPVSSLPGCSSRRRGSPHRSPASSGFAGQRGRVHHRRSAARQSGGHRSDQGGFPRAREIPAGDQGRADHPHQGRRLSRRRFRGEGLRHRSAPRRCRPQPARARNGPKHRSAAASGPVRAGDGAAAVQGRCAERAGAGHRAARRRSVRVQDRRRQGAHDQGRDRHQARGQGGDRRGSRRRRRSRDRRPAQDPRRQRRVRRRRRSQRP